MAEMDTDDLLLSRASQWHRCEDGLFCETRVTVLKFNNESLGCVVRHVDGGGRGGSGASRVNLDVCSIGFLSSIKSLWGVDSTFSLSKNNL